jgi:hypothetical protein
MAQPGAQGKVWFEFGKGRGMSTEGVLLGGAVVYGVLAATSVAFNRHVDQQPPAQRPDGLTAVWVAVGVLYTLLGGTLVVALAMPPLLDLGASHGGWAVAAAVLGVYLAAFVASGAPMLWGDLHRSHRERTLGAVLAAAERAITE